MFAIHTFSTKQVQFSHCFEVFDICFRAEVANERAFGYKHCQMPKKQDLQMLNQRDEFTALQSVSLSGRNMFAHEYAVACMKDVRSNVVEKIGILTIDEVVALKKSVAKFLSKQLMKVFVLLLRVMLTMRSRLSVRKFICSGLLRWICELCPWLSISTVHI